MIYNNKYYLGKRGDIQVTYKPNTYNSVVSPGAKFEFEIDIIDVLARDGGDGIRYGVCAIDNFTKLPRLFPLEI